MSKKTFSEVKDLFDRIYVEIGNICNLKCDFCPGTKRAPRQMSIDEFLLVCEKLDGFGKHLFLHVMGEPLLHPKLGELIEIAGAHGFSVSITTNGTLIGKCAELLLKHSDILHKVSISLHAPEGNGIGLSLKGQYLDEVIALAKLLSEKHVNVVFRLWNLDTEDKPGANSTNGKIEERLHLEYPEPWQKRYSGYRLAYRTFLEYDGIFTWPTESDAEFCECGTCHALTQQIAILADGTVVPCCLDSDGNIPLGNIFSQSMENIVSSPLFIKMKKGFSERKMVHPLCQKCLYARRFR